jgi:hypothetical protein
MIRTGSRTGAAYSRVDITIIERPAKDGARDRFACAVLERRDVVDILEPARGDDRDRHRIRQLSRQRDVHAGLQTIAGNVGDDDGPDAAAFKRLCEFHRMHVGRFSPALHGHQPFARVDADSHLIRERLRGLLHEGWIAHCRRAEDHARNTGAQPALDAFHVADAAAELHRRLNDVENGRDRILVH